MSTRSDLLPNEPHHPHAADSYLKISFQRIQKLKKPILNIIPRRVSFGFTSLKQLTSATNLLELYSVPATEQLILQGLARRGILVIAEYPVGYSSGRFRIDLVVACRNGWLAIECDNDKAHRSASQQAKDQHKDYVLGYHGWRLVRLRETDVLNHFDRSLARLEMAIASLGGLAANENIHPFDYPRIKSEPSRLDGPDCFSKA